MHLISLDDPTNTDLNCLLRFFNLYFLFQSHSHFIGSFYECVLAIAQKITRTLSLYLGARQSFLMNPSLIIRWTVNV